VRKTEAMAEKPEAKLREALAKPVYCGDTYIPFGELGVPQARQLGAELGSVGSWGPMSKVGSVARSWHDLAETIEKAGAEKVSDLPAAQAVDFAERLWILPPGGGLL
jgi:hypothetical protein